MDEVRWIQDAVSGYDLVLLQLEVPIEVNRAVARWAREAGVPVILNPAPATELDDKLLSLVSYLIPNEQEASQETHLPLRFDGNGPHDEDLRAIAAALRAKGVEHVIITLGGYGSAVGGSLRPPVYSLRPHGACGGPHCCGGLLCWRAVHGAGRGADRG